MGFNPGDQAGPPAASSSPEKLVATHKVEGDHGIISEPYRIRRQGNFSRVETCPAASAAGARAVRSL